jgi:hypothetical protein
MDITSGWRGHQAKPRDLSPPTYERFDPRAPLQPEHDISLVVWGFRNRNPSVMLRISNLEASAVAIRKQVVRFYMAPRERRLLA